MRKVTASAVILTALTGCSQSSVPSAQWSFEVPSSEPNIGTEATANSSLTSELSADARPFIQAATGRTGSTITDSAFGRSNTGSSETNGNTLSTASALANGDFSSLVTTATNPRANAFIQATARPDPIAQVRSYLGRSSSPTAITSRVPYSSQVYLPSSPPAPPLSALGTVPAASPFQPSSSAIAQLETPVVHNSQQAVEPWVAATASVSTPAAAPTVTSMPALAQTPVELPATNTLSTASVTPQAFASYEPDVYGAEDIPSLFDNIVLSEEATQPETISERATTVAVSSHSAPAPENVSAQNNSIEDDLPVLSPSQQTTGETEQGAIEASDTRQTSIGTAILMDLQRSARAEEANALVTASQEQETVSQQTVSQEVIAQDVVRESANSQGVIRREASSPISVFEPAIPAQQPTLERLLQSMPQREQAPLIASFKTSSTSTSIREQLLRPDSSGSELILELDSVEADIAETDSVEADQRFTPQSSLPSQFHAEEVHTEEVYATEIYREEAGLTAAEVNFIETVERVSISDSPLLSGLLEDEADSQSTIYVPISGAESIDASAAFVQAAIVALGQEANRAQFIGFHLPDSHLQDLQLREAHTPSRTFQSIKDFSTKSSGKRGLLSAPSSSKATVPAAKYRQRIIWNSAEI